jgi:hypothetical protein
LTREQARIRAAALDKRAHAEISERLYGPAYSVLSQIRAYLLRRSNEISVRNNPIQLLKFRSEANGMALIVLGPTFDKGATPEHFYFDSGARLSFGLALRKRDNGSELVSFRFHYQLPEGRSPEYFRFDLNETLHLDSLAEPRCHLHPGMENVRIPLPLQELLQVLDQIFFVLESNI